MSDALTFEKVWSMFKETDLKFKETDLKFQETAAQMKETDRKIKELGRRFGDLGNRLGEFVEGMVKPACVRLFRERGIVVHEVHSRTMLTDGKSTLELDLLVVNDNEMVAVECKSRLTQEAVERHLARLSEIKGLVPKYERMKIYGAVAGIVVDRDARELAERSGLFVLAQSGETVAILNPTGFAPAAF